MKKSKNGPTGAIAAALAICLIPSALKLAGVVDWPWWIATAPLWAAPVIVVAFGIVMAVVTIFVAFADGKADRR
jgi:hypothetical protein